MSEAALKLWNDACNFLQAPTTEECWKIVVENSPPDDMWHSLNHCVSHQAKTWQEMLNSGIVDVTQPAAFKLAIILRHTPMNLTGKILEDLLGNHPQSQDLTSYIVTLLSDDDPIESPVDPNGPPSPAPLRDLQLYGDCEIAILAGDAEDYKKHTELMRCEYKKMTNKDFVKLRAKVLDQFIRLPKMFHTLEFAKCEKLARQNIVNELKQLKEEYEETKK